LAHHNPEVEPVPVEVRIPSMLQKFTGGERLLQYESKTVATLLVSIEEDHPGIGDQLMEEGELRRFVNIFLNDEDIRFLNKMDTELNDGDVLAILPALAGG
jgi:molybdopterin converting factor small subunit